MLVILRQKDLHYEVQFLTNKLRDISYEAYNEGLLKSEDKTK